MDGTTEPNAKPHAFLLIAFWKSEVDGAIQEKASFAVS